MIVTLVLSGSWLLISCGGGGGTSSPMVPTLQSITVSPQNATVAAGLTQQFTAAGNYSDGTSKALSPVTWSTSDVTLATIGPTGLLTALKQGAVTVSASFSAMTGGAPLTVGPPNLMSLSVSPQNTTVAAGLTQQFTATGSFSDGSSQALSTVTWLTSDETVATADAAGLVTTLKQGTVTITAASGSITNTAALNVGPAIPMALNIVPANSKVVIGASTSTKLSAILTYSDSSTTDVSNVATWSNTNSFTASIDSSGNVTPLHTGYTGISATNGTFTANTGFTVIAEPRYLYFTNGAGRLASKAIIDSNSGQPRMAGYIPTGANNDATFPCPTTDPSNKFLYVGSAVSNGQSLSGELQGYSLDPVSGGLTPLTGSPFPQTAPVGCIDFEPTGEFAFAANNVNSSTYLLTHSQDANTGELTLVNSTNLPGAPTRAAIDPLGQYLYVGASSDGFSTTFGLGYSINSSTGTLTPISGSPFTLSNLGGTFTFHPNGNYLFMANSNGQSIDTYCVVRATGMLTFAGTIATCINPTPVRFSPDGNFAYSTCSMDVSHDPGSASLESFAVGSNGLLTHLGSVPLATVASDLSVDPSGQFLCVSTTTPYMYLSAIGTDGVAKALRRVGTQPDPSLSTVVVGGASPVKLTPQNAYITSIAGSSLLTYGVNSEGTLTAPQSTATPLSPSSLSLWPWGSDLAAASNTTGVNLMIFPLSSGTDLPGSGQILNFATTAGGVAIDPSGQFAFETDSTNGVVYAFQEFGTTWALSINPTTPPTNYFPAGAGAGPVVVDPSGLLVYVANQIDNSISAYQYWGTSAELFESTGLYVSPYPNGSPFALGAEPLQLTIDPNEAFLYVLCGDSTLRVFAIDYISGGHIAQVASVQLTGMPSGLTAEPTGHFVYTSDTTGVKAFSVNPQTGALTSVPLNPAITLANITGMYAEPAGQFLYITTGAQNVPGAVLAYSINADGTLTAVSALPVATPNLPWSMVFFDDIR